jgi:hypothetical protein
MANEPLFDRRWAVTIGPPGQAGRKWDNLRVSFSIEKTGDATPNALDLAIYNLSADSRAWIAKKGMAVMVDAGYADPGAKLLYSGTLERVSHSKEGPDWVSRIESADGVAAHRSIILAESFGPGTTEASIVRAVADKLGVTVGELKGLSDTKFGQGRQLTGPAGRELDALCRSRGLRWSIQDGVLQILPLAQALNLEAVVLSAETGLVGSPDKTERGVKMVSLLQGGINPGRLIKLESRNIKGLYIAEKVTHSGDSHGRDWYTTIEAFLAS